MLNLENKSKSRQNAVFFASKTARKCKNTKIICKYQFKILHTDFPNTVIHITLYR